MPPEIERFLPLAREALRADPGIPALSFGLEPKDPAAGIAERVTEQRQYLSAMLAARVKVRMLKLKLKGPSAQAALKEFMKDPEANDFLAALMWLQLESRQNSL